MNNKRKIAIGSLLGILLIGIFGVTYAVYSYSLLGENNKLIAGDIYMHYKESNTLTLSNAMPSSTYDPNNYFEFTIDGKNTNTKYDIYYDITLNYGDEIADSNRNIRIKDELLKFRLTEIIDGDEQEIFTNRSYINLNGERIYKNTIEANTSNEIMHRYRLYFWISDTTIIGNTSNADYSMEDWNKVYGSVKVTVTGDFTEKSVKDNLFKTMKDNAVMDNIQSEFVSNQNGINFSQVSSDTNGKGLYLRAGTENTSYPIYYYRGNVDNNNVIFGNLCWQIVRTTDTGGIKVIYNGEPSKKYEYTETESALTREQYLNVSEDTEWIFDNTDNTWNITITDNSSKEIIFNVPDGLGYSLKVTGTTGPSTGGTYLFYKDDRTVYGYGNRGGESIAKTYNYGELTESNTIKFTYEGSSSNESPITFKISMMGHLGKKNLLCNNQGDDSRLIPQNNYVFGGYGPLGSAGYSYGYTKSNYNYSAHYVSSSYHYADGKYYLDNPESASYPMENKRYSIGQTMYCSNHELCADRIVYTYYTERECTYESHISICTYGVNLLDGDSLQDYIDATLLNSKDDHKSEMHQFIDDWYQGIISNNQKKYVEDTTWCNDRSIAYLGGWDPENSWLEPLMFSGHYRLDISNHSNETTNIVNTNMPKLTCDNKNDEYSLANNKLTSPLALLTADEISLAGGVYGVANNNYYLYSGEKYHTMTPSTVERYVKMFDVETDGSISQIDSDTDIGVRPSLSLKNSINILSGTGTKFDPYILESEN